MDYEDKTIQCSDCGSEFIHPAADQARYAERGFNDPKRCRPCRAKRKAESGGGGPRSHGHGGHGGGGGGYGGGGHGGGGGRPYGGPSHGGGGHGGGHGHGGPRGGGGGRSFDRPRESFDVVCAECGAQTTVPFKPRGDRPVYCRDCFRSKR